MNTKPEHGINLLEPEPDDSDIDNFELVKEVPVGKGQIPAAVRQAIIIEKANQAPTQLIAVRYDVAPETVNRIWRDFCNSAAKVRKVADETPEETRTWLKGKALVAIESGLDCERDPYRRAAVGVNVMKGIGEFKSDHGDGAQINVLVNAVPEEWKQRYITAPRDIKQLQKVNTNDNEQ